jgi:hypothetical protein
MDHKHSPLPTNRRSTTEEEKKRNFEKAIALLVKKSHFHPCFIKAGVRSS